MRVATDFTEARSRAVGTVGLVPTMGFLHEGHLSLLAAARQANDTVTMSLFVNPLQFDESSDLARYPRNLDRDLTLAAEAGADIVFAPDETVIYDQGPRVEVPVPEMSVSMEGAHRPGHFAGMATVVAKLFAGLQPDAAYFGRKDAQQLAIVRRLAIDLAMPIVIVGCSTTREFDGLALSSRNVFLSGSERAAALSLSAGLLLAAELAEAGERDCAVLERAVSEAIRTTSGIEFEYAAVAAQSDVRRLRHLDRDAFLAAAVRVSRVRLIDNIHFDVSERGVNADRGVRLGVPSILYEADGATSYPARSG
jgi:pantoate--beta-alanine ligase